MAGTEVAKYFRLILGVNSNDRELGWDGCWLKKRSG